MDMAEDLILWERVGRKLNVIGYRWWWVPSKVDNYVVRIANHVAYLTSVAHVSNLTSAV